jgi:hypothetical protein
MKLTIREISSIFETEFKFYRSINVGYLKGDRRSLQFFRNGCRFSESDKQSILTTIMEKLRGVENIESIKWKVGEHHYGNYDYLRVVVK